MGKLNLGRLNPYVCITGRTRLIGTVLFGIQSHWSMYIFLPKGVVKKMHAILAKFLWGGTLDRNCQYKVPWNGCKSKREGGLGFKDLLLLVSCGMKCCRTTDSKC